MQSLLRIHTAVLHFRFKFIAFFALHLFPPTLKHPSNHSCLFLSHSSANHPALLTFPQTSCSLFFNDRSVFTSYATIIFSLSPWIVLRCCEVPQSLVFLYMEVFCCQTLGTQWLFPNASYITLPGLLVLVSFWSQSWSFMLWKLWAIGRSVSADLLHELSWVTRGLSWIWQIKLLLIIQFNRRYSQPSHGLVLPLLALKGVFSSSALGSAPILPSLHWQFSVWNYLLYVIPHSFIWNKPYMAKI